MNILAILLITLVALEHVYFLVLEMFLWTKPQGMKTFRNTPEKAEMTKVLAANQGLYNGFLAAGLIWSFFIENAEWQQNVALFFLGCVAVAGIYGTFTADRKIFFVQALPALLGIGLILVRSM